MKLFLNLVLHYNDHKLVVECSSNHIDFTEQSISSPMYIYCIVFYHLNHLLYHVSYVGISYSINLHVSKKNLLTLFH
jgi:hypothetical protein